MDNAGNKGDLTLLTQFEAKHFSGAYSDYYAIKRQNFQATIGAFPKLWKAFLLLDDIFMAEFADMYSITDLSHVMPFVLFCHFHSQFRLAVELGFSGAIAEAGSLVRVGIESAAYACKLHKEPHLIPTWLSKFDGAPEEKAFRKAFVDKRKQSMFSGSKELERLFDFWCAFSEDSSHANVRDMGRRAQIDPGQTHVSWVLHYFETHPKILAMSLYTLLHATTVVELLMFRTFKTRLELDLGLEKKRALFYEFKEQARLGIVKQFKLVPPWFQNTP